MTVISLPFQPVAIMLEQIKLSQRSDSLRIDGIDLDSGRRVSVKVRFNDRDRLCRPAGPHSDLVLLLSVERLLP